MTAKHDTAELEQFRQDFKTHVDEFHRHVVACQEYVDDCNAKFESLFDMQKQYSASIERYEAKFNLLFEIQESNSMAIASIRADTKTIVQIYQDLQAVGRVGLGLKKFSTWLLQFGIIGTVFAGFIAWIIHLLDKVGSP